MKGHVSSGIADIRSIVQTCVSRIFRDMYVILSAMIENMYVHLMCLHTRMHVLKVNVLVTGCRFGLGIQSFHESRMGGQNVLNCTSGNHISPMQLVLEVCVEHGLGWVPFGNFD